MAIINAVFENTDAAEWALVNLRGSGVEVKAYRVSPMAQGIQSGYPYRHTNDIGVRDFTLGNYTPGPFDDTDVRRVYDIRSAEVTMQLIVPSIQAQQAQRYLVGQHATHVSYTNER